MDELPDERRDARPLAAIVVADEGPVAECRIAAAAEVEAAFPDASRREPPRAEHGGGELPGGAHSRERRRRGVELLDGRGRAHDRGTFGEQRLPGREVVDVGAVARPGQRQLVAQIPLQFGQTGAAGGCQPGPQLA